MALQVIIKIFGLLLALLGSYLLAGEYLLGERFKKLEETFNKMSNFLAHVSFKIVPFTKVAVNPPSPNEVTLSPIPEEISLIPNVYRRRGVLILGYIILLILLLLWIFFLGKFVYKDAPIFMKIPIILLSSFLIKLTSNQIKASPTDIFNESFKLIKKLEEDSKKFTILTEELERLAVILGKQKMKFKSVNKFRNKPEVKLAVERLEKVFSEELKLIATE